MNNKLQFIRQAFILALALTVLPTLASAHGVSETDQETLAGGNLLAYIYVGAKHMLTGYDHILFLVGVVFFLKDFKDILRFVSFFTLGHSITLIGATLVGAQANDHFIDAIIALSVIYKGFENLDGFKRFFQTSAPNLRYMVFAFGLIHGFGLSTRLQQLSVGNEATFNKIVAFNVGVELGQVLALVPILYLIKHWRNRKGYHVFQYSTNWGLVVAGAALFIFQVVGFVGHMRLGDKVFF